VPEVDRIGRYAVQRRLGAGAFALVWLAHDEVLDAPVAIKVLAENWAHQLDLRARFVAEARVLRRADSDRVVRVFDIGDLPDGRPYFVMTYADRGTLEERLSGSAPLPVAAALRLAEQVARGVAVLHGLGVIHRDLKPSNVLFQSTAGGGERLLIADLGLAKDVAHASGFTVAAGSPGYMAPEQQVIGGGIDVRVDVYGIGAIAHRMLTGVVPRLPGSLAPPGTLRPGLPDGTDQVLSRALAEDRERRWPSARSLADALAELADRALAAEPADAGHEVDEGTTVVVAALAYDHPVTAAGTPTADWAAGEPVAAGAAGGTGVAARPVGEPAAASGSGADTAVRVTTRPGYHPVQHRPEPRPVPRRRRRWRGVAALVAASLLAGGGAAAYMLRYAGPATTTVRDRTGAITVTVPRGWGGQLQAQGWSPKAAGFGTETDQAGLAVAADLSRWRDPASAQPGVFVGVTRDANLADQVGRVQHAGCARTPMPYHGGSLTGTILQHACPGAASFAEVALSGPGGLRIYVQIKQPSGENHTADILGSLQVSAG
jgi:eukaryotic-like serine/threonine-protein kinase